jgi:tetratricopeptide (TPR) repeat protein
LLRLAMSEPRQALDRGSSVLAASADPMTRSFALQAMAVAQRELGDGRAALRLVRRSLVAARRSASPPRVADVEATLGATLALQGRTKPALQHLDSALGTARGVNAARIRVRRGGVLHVVGRDIDAMRDLRAAMPALRSAGDRVYEARALSTRALVHAALGEHARADKDLARAEQLLLADGQLLESAFARHNRGQLAYRTGDLPAALRHLDEAEHIYREVGERDADLELQRSHVLLAMGMPDDARRHAAAAAEILEGNTAYANLRAEALLVAATAALAAGETAESRELAAGSVRAFRDQRRNRWAMRAQRVELLAAWLAGEATPAMLRRAQEAAVGLESWRDADAIEAHVLVGRIALRLDRLSVAEKHLSAAAASRGRGPAISRATGWLAQALLCDLRKDDRAVARSCGRGLDLLDAHRLTLGATEMRARATFHGTELATMALVRAAASSRTAELVAWSERWRATALSTPPVRPPDDAELTAELALLRTVTARLEEARGEGRPTTGFAREQSRIEATVRERTLRVSGTAMGLGSVVDSKLDVVALRDRLGAATLVDLVEIDGLVHVVTFRAGRWSRHVAGSTATVGDELEFARFGLRRVAMATTESAIRSAAGSLEGAGEALQKGLIGAAADLLGDGEVVVVPSGRLHAVPWSLLPALRDRPVTVAPSIAAWLRSRGATPPQRPKVTLVAGPHLGTGGAEVHEVCDRYAGATLLTGGAATADAVLAGLDGASLAHVAAHGTFRSDNPLFSSLQMSDGPLTVHDIERLHRPPHRLLLSSCDSGLGATAGADELLGLASALIALGTAGLLASVVPVNDAATVPLMVAVHGRLREGATLAQALHQARRWLGDSDPVLAATGMSFVALGAA